MHLSDYYKVEGLIRLAEGRMYYLVNDLRPDRSTRRCWECGSEDNPNDPGGSCASCNASLAVKRFLLSSRWDRGGFDAYLAFFQKQLVHPALLSPCDVFPFPEDNPTQICSVVPYNNESLMLDEAAPLPIDRVVGFAQRAAGMLGMLVYNGVRLASLQRANFLIRPNGEILLYDPEVDLVQDTSLAPEEAGDALVQLGELLRRYTPIEEPRWQGFFQRVESGEYPTVPAFGRALQAVARDPNERTDATQHAGMTDVGLLRMLNEDNWGWVRLREGVDLFAVADGMGGHDSGEVASKLAIETLARVARERLANLEHPDVEVAEGILDEAFQEANNTIKGSAEVRGNDMGTTLVACMVVEDRFSIWANVGDSRGYLSRNGQLLQVTRDHSLVARWVEQGKLTPEEARHHPHSNILLRTVGTERDVEIDLTRRELEPGDRLVLCSDGLWGEVDDADIEALVNQHDDNRAASRELVRAAHVGGGKDNVTVVVVGIPRQSLKKGVTNASSWASMSAPGTPIASTAPPASTTKLMG